MDKFPNNSPESPEPPPLPKFQAEMAEIKRKEEAGELPTAHFTGGENVKPILPEELTDEDRLVWEKLDTMTPEEFDEYRKSVLQKEGNTSRRQFLTFVLTKRSIRENRKSHQEKLERDKTASEAPLAGFRAEIMELQKSHPTSDLRRLNATELTMEDYSMWQRVKNFESGSADLSRQEIEAYQKKMQTSGSRSRRHFAAFITNKLAVIWYRKGM